MFLDAGSLSLPFHQIRDAAGLQPTTAHRLLTDLVEHGWLTQREDRADYSLGPLLLSFGVLAADGLSHRSVAEPHIRRLRDACGETVIVAELHGDKVVPVVRADGLFEMRMNQQLGARYPAHAGATGKLLLAHREPAELELLISGAAFQPLTARTIVDPEELRRQLGEIHRLGFSVSRGERVDDAVAISAPLRDRAGVVIAAVTLSGVASRFGREELIAAVRATCDCAAAISHELGWMERRGSEPSRSNVDSEYDALVAEHCDAALRDRTERRPMRGRARS